MNIINLFNICPDVKNHIYSYLPNAAYYFCNLVCKDFIISNEKHVRVNMPEYVGKYGNMDLINYCVENNISYMDDICDYVSLYGHLNILKQLRKNGFHLLNHLSRYAAINGHLDIIIWLHKKLIIDDNGYVNNAIKNDHMHIVQYSLTNYKYTSQEILYIHKLAAKYGKLNILKYLHDKVPYCGNEIFEILNSENHFDALKWYYELYGHSIITNFSDICMDSGNIKILEWFIELDIFPNGITIRNAVYDDKYFILSYYFDKYPFLLDEYISMILEHAASNGSFNILKWCYGLRPELFKHHYFNRCLKLKVNQEVFLNTRVLELIKLSRLFNHQTLEYAILYKLWDFAEWLLDNDCPYNMENYSILKKYNANLAIRVLTKELESLQKEIS